jgi:hypothetical protein
VFFAGAVMVVAVNPDLFTAAVLFIGATGLVHIVLFVMLYRSLDGDHLLSPTEIVELKRLVLLLGYLGALETFHALRRAARKESKRRQPHPAL